MRMYRVAAKMAPFFVLLNFSFEIDQFSNFFDHQNLEKICNKPLIKIPSHLKCDATLPCEMSVSSKFKATIENKTISVTTHFRSASSSSKADAFNI